MQTLAILLAVFTGILALLVLMQTFIFFGIFKAFRQLTDRVDAMSKDVLKNVEAVAVKAEDTLVTIREIGDGLMPVKDKMVDVAEIIHQRVVRVDDFLEETTSSARSEVQRVQNRIESATNRFEEILDMLQDSVAAPINEISAITQGIRAGIDMLFRRRKSPSKAPDRKSDRTSERTPDPTSDPTSDEDDDQDDAMFI